MSEMVERVAKAIFDAEFDFLGIESPWPDADQVRMIAEMRTPDDFRMVARAAIKAMMEPTEAMDSAGYTDIYVAPDKTCKKIYQDMINAALKP